MKKILSLILCLCLALPLFCLQISAAEDEKWLFIDGENLTRSVDSAIIYIGVQSTKQSIWGNNVVCDAEGLVTEIVESGNSKAENLLVPEGGFVVSASGIKGAWLKKNIKKGDRLYYDAYTQRLFKFDSSGIFDPYFVKEFEVKTLSDGYVISNVEASATPLFSYDIFVDANGYVVSRGGNMPIPEGGYRVSAATKRDMESLIVCAPLGAKCVATEGVLTFTYDKTMLNKTVELAISEASLRLENATLANSYADLQAASALIEEAKLKNARGINYREATTLAHRLSDELSSYLTESVSAETRAAFHTPTEKDIIGVRDVIKSAKNAGLNTLYLRITNGYGSFVPLPEGNKFKQDEAFSGFDVLRAYITVCEEEGVELGLCFDVFYNEFASIASPEWAMKSNGEANEIAERYYSPTNTEFLEYFCEYITYIIETYGVTEILLDSLRYPKQEGNADFGYDYVTMQNFAAELGISIDKVEAIKTQLFESPYWNQWVAYRKSAVDNAAKRITDAIKSVRPDASIIAVSARDTVEHFYMQDCIGWLNEGLIDGITLALYDGRDGGDKNDELAYFDSTVTEKGEIFSAYTEETAFFFVALDSGASIPASFIESAINETRSINSDGFIFSSLNDYLAQNYYARLSLGAMRKEAVSFIAEADKALTEILDFSKEKLDHYLASGIIDEGLVQQALGKINDLRVKIDNGEYTKDDVDNLKSDIALIFAESTAKESIVSDFKAGLKISNLKKEEYVPVPPDQGDETSVPDESVNESSDEEIVEESTTEEIEQEEKKERAPVEIGTVLIYLFVGITLIAAIISTAVSLKRRSKRPKGSHMPRASLAENKDNSDE